jgi:uncharacterized protein HemX
VSAVAAALGALRAALGLLSGGAGLQRLLAAGAVGLLIGAALGGWGAWKLQGWRQAQQAQERAEQQARAERAARADELVRINNAERIAHEDHRRSQRTLDRARAAERAAAGLREQIAQLNARELPAHPELAAAALEARTARDLLGRCAEAYRRVDGRAQALGDQVTGLQDFAREVCRAGQGGPLPAPD